MVTINIRKIKWFIGFYISIKLMALVLMEESSATVRGEAGTDGALGALGPWILKQLPLEVEDSEVGTIRSSSSFSRICVQCTSAWISKGSAGFMICCSLWLPTRVPGPEVEEVREGEMMEEGSRK